jgi:hypothetical protein
MMSKALMLENCRGEMEHKTKLVRQHQLGCSSRPRVSTSSAGPMFVLLNRYFSLGRRQLDKDFLHCSVK